MPAPINNLKIKIDDMSDYKQPNSRRESNTSNSNNNNINNK